MGESKLVQIENDFESPGYEYLRSFQSMENLYYKLLVINYRKDFCAKYKCPPINKHYFSIPSGNQGEQQFLFMCLCAWLMKEKCQMNLELAPEEYEDTDQTIGAIAEAVRILLTPDNGSHWSATKSTLDPLTFPLSRLKQGFGPEVIWTLNILADRALELAAENTLETKKVEFIFNNSGSDRNQKNAQFITIGQPVGGSGLAARPLGGYQIDDPSLLLDEGAGNPVSSLSSGEADSKSIPTSNIDSDDWYRQVERARPYLESIKLNDDEPAICNWQNHLGPLLSLRRAIDGFMDTSKPVLEAISNQMDKQLQIIGDKEQLVCSKFKQEIEDFLEVWKDFSMQEARNKHLLSQVKDKTDKLEIHDQQLRRLTDEIAELGDGSKLRKLEQTINVLERENQDFNAKIGLLLNTYTKIHTKD